MITNKKFKILIVEDDRTLRNDLNEMISLYFSCFAASNVDDALRILSDEKIDLVLSDILMPGKSGLDLVKIIKHNASYNEIPILLLSALDSDEHIKKGYEVGAIDYITKPFRISQLLDKIRALLTYKFDLLHNPVNTVLNKNKEFLDRSVGNDFTEKLDKLISERYASSELNIHEISDKLNVSLSTLQRQCKKIKHTTINKLITEYRLQMAEMMVLKSNLSISEISFCTGFCSIQYFSKCFKTKYGKSPTDYKKRVPLNG